MTTLSQARSFALSLPEATQADHHGMDSFRVRGKIFATVPDDMHVRVMVDEAETNALVAEFPDICAPVYWGARLACVAVTLATAEPSFVRELLTEAWRRKAPKKLAAQLEA
jgi:hypothetical protein